MRPHPVVLLACAPSEAPMLERLVPREAEVIRVSSIEEALERMTPGVDAIVCSLQFDESRMLELAREAHSRLPDVPLLCCSAAPSRISSAWMHAAAIAAATLGAAAFLDLQEGLSASDMARLLLQALNLTGRG
jgi:DNA-binding NtrC family response regulator